MNVFLLISKKNSFSSNSISNIFQFLTISIFYSSPWFGRGGGLYPPWNMMDMFDTVFNNWWEVEREKKNLQIHLWKNLKFRPKSSRKLLFYYQGDSGNRGEDIDDEKDWKVAITCSLYYVVLFFRETHCEGKLHRVLFCHIKQRQRDKNLFMSTSGEGEKKSPSLKKGCWQTMMNDS